jgi:hypothetical protein
LKNSFDGEIEMDWDAIGAIGEVLGAVAVIATLLYLGTQISQTNRIAISSVARELQQKYSDLYTLIATDSEIKGLVTRLRNSDYITESEEEEEQLESFCLLMLGLWLSTGVAHAQGQIELNLYQVYCKDVEVKLFKWPGMRAQMKETLKKYPTTKNFEIFKPILD